MSSNRPNSKSSNDVRDQKEEKTSYATGTDGQSQSQRVLRNRTRKTKSPNVLLYELSAYGLDQSKMTQKHGNPSDARIVIETISTKSSKNNTKSKTKSKTDSSDEEEESNNEYMMEIEYKNCDNELYTWWDALYEFGSFVFDKIRDSDEPELQQMTQDCFQSQKWSLHATKSLVSFADPNDKQKQNPIAIVDGTRNVNFCYSFEVEHIKNEFVKYIDISTLKSDTLVINNDIAGDWLSGYDLSLINISDVANNGLQSFVSALGNSIVVHHVSAELLIHKNAFQDVLDQLLTITLKDIRRKMRYREQSIVITGGNGFAGPLWSKFRQKTVTAGMETVGIEDKKRGFGDIYANIVEWKKLYDNKFFEKMKLLNGTNHNITLDYIHFRYYYVRKYIEYETKVLVD